MIYRYIKPADLGFLAIIAAYILICWGIASATGFADRFSPVMYLSTGLLMSTTFFIGYVLYRLLRASWLLVKEKPRSPARFLWQDLRKGPLRGEIYLRALPIFTGFFFFFSTFSSMKMLIGKINPFATSGWDQYFAQLDQTLHFGVDPWLLMQPLLGYPIVTKILSFIYIFWLMAFFLVLYWQLFQTKDAHLRAQFFYTFALTWAINGTFLALYFASAGPCYFENVTGADHFAPLMDYLYNANEHYKIYALKTQALLWDNFQADEENLAAGISAFPSIHCATAFLFVLLSWRSQSIIKWGFVAFFAAILLGSVHLGWHYAIDGYFSVLITWGLWWVSGKLVQRLD